MGSLENIIAINNLSPYIDDSMRDSLLQSIGVSLEDYNQRVKGLNQQEEFVLILYLLDACKNITGFDEGVSKLGNKTYTPDLAIELNDGKKFFLEIKYTEKQKYSISGGNLDKRIEYAASLNQELYFAISIRGFWMMFHSDYLKKNHGKISINDSSNSILDEVLDTKSYLFPTGIKIRSVYSQNTKKGMDISFNPYGELVSYELYYREKKLFGIEGKESQYYYYMLLLSALQDRLSCINQTIDKCGDETVICDMDNGKDCNYIPEYLFLLSLVMHTKNNADEIRDANTVINELIDNKDVPSFKIENYRGAIQEMFNLGIPIMYIRKGVIYNMHREEVKYSNNS